MAGDRATPTSPANRQAGTGSIMIVSLRRWFIMSSNMPASAIYAGHT